MCAVGHGYIDCIESHWTSCGPSLLNSYMRPEPASGAGAACLENVNGIAGGYRHGMKVY